MSRDVKAEMTPGGDRFRFVPSDGFYRHWKKIPSVAAERQKLADAYRKVRRDVGGRPLARLLFRRLRVAEDRMLEDALKEIWG